MDLIPVSTHSFLMVNISIKLSQRNVFDAPKTAVIDCRVAEQLGEWGEQEVDLISVGAHPFL